MAYDYVQGLNLPGQYEEGIDTATFSDSLSYNQT